MPWYLFCVLASVLALPLCLRLYRGLGDRGASLSLGVGLLSVNLFSWLIALEWFPSAGPAGSVRLLWVALGAVTLVATVVLQGQGRVHHWTSWVPCGLLLSIGFLWLPHGLASVGFGMLATALLSWMAWEGSWSRFRRDLKGALHPLIMAHVLFLIGFLFFVNVRSYIPYATYDRGLHLAEKWGNYQHLSAVMRSDAMPPRDLWFSGAWTNYYYGAHLLTGTIAKATATPQPIAFNLGLATVFALSLSLGFGFTLSLVHLMTRRFRVPWSYADHQGWLWGLLGALAIAMFGNLDPWRQLFTRDLDWGTQQRIERRLSAEQEEWKLRRGISADEVLRLYAAVAAVPRSAQLEALRGELARQSTQRSGLLRERQAMVASANRLLQDDQLTPRQREDALLNLLVPGANTPLYRALPSVNAVELEERLIRLILGGRFAEAVASVEALPVSTDEPAAVQTVRVWADETLEAIMGGEAMAAVEALLTNEDDLSVLARLTLRGAGALREEWDEAAAFRQLSARVALIDEWFLAAMDNQELSPDGPRIAGVLQAAAAAAKIDVEAALRRLIGPPPPGATRPTIAQHRFAWQNVSTIDFWEPSRAIKGTPAHIREEGTITEFPYFSALLGDHHPHHFALIWTLLALTTCVALLRIQRGGPITEAVWLRRSGPLLLMMAILIGYVFSVNIWDAVVLAPLYGVVIVIARWSLVPADGWRWVGFAGFLMLVALLVALFVNSSPTVTPVFQDFKAFAVAVLLLTAALPACLYLQPWRSAWQPIAACVGLAILILLVGAWRTSDLRGADGATWVAVGVRDALVFLMAASLAALWTMRHDAGSGPRWWYGTGLVYLVTGLAALLVTYPFKAFFVTPLMPALRMFSSLTPPVLGFELTQRGQPFWAMFWRASPVNPFPADLRSELGDFFLHWGLFVIPIMALIVVRLIGSLRHAPAAQVLFVSSLTLAVAGFTRVYLQYWAGALALAMVVPCLWFATTRRQRAEGPAWALLAVAFFWCWFVEALNFDDDYAGHFERYNTPFKIFYPLWPIFAGGMVVALRELFARFPIAKLSGEQVLLAPAFWCLAGAIGVGVPLIASEFLPKLVAQILFFVLILPIVWLMFVILLDSTEGEASGRAMAVDLANRLISRWPALGAGVIMAILGLYYPLGATVTRTREFFTWPLAGTMELRLEQRRIYTDRTLDATAHFVEFPEYRQDWKAWNWLRQNTDRDVRILERAGADGYAPTGRIAAGSARISVLNWKHHEEQWRGRARPAYDWLKRAYLELALDGGELMPNFSPEWPGGGEALTDELRRDLRLAGNKDRLRILQAVYPEASVQTLYRLRRLVERNDLTMSMAMMRLMSDVEAMYTSNDDALVRRLFARHGIRYVVVGDLERGIEPYPGAFTDRFVGYGFTQVFDSGAPEHLLPNEGSVRNPTLIFEVRPTFPAENVERVR